MYRRDFIKLAGASFVCLALTACGNQAKAKNPDYADDEAMCIIAKGFKERSDFVESKDYTGSDADLKKAVQMEIDCDSSLKERQFKNSDLHEVVLDYLDSLEKQLEIFSNYSSSSIDFQNAWLKAYDKRCIILKEMVDDYGLTVDKSCQEYLDQIVANGTNVLKKTDIETSLINLIEGAVFDVIDGGHGYYEYTTILENTTDYNFENVGIVVALYDEDGVKDRELYAHTSSWKKGEKVKFSAGSADINAANIEASVRYYAVAE